MYKIVRRILFLTPPETAHKISMASFKLACSVPFIKRLLQKLFNPQAAGIHTCFGLRFRNPVGLGAGFDKNAKYLRELETLGFGFVEIGTVTPRPQPGNPKPRVFRLPKDGALINRMGFNNDGVEAVALRLKKWRRKLPDFVSGHGSPVQRLIVGGNIGKNKNTPNEEAWKDYEICFRALHPYVDFFVVNVSSPNTPGLRALQEKESLKKILTHLQQMNLSFNAPKPILLKIAPDLGWEEINDVIDLAKEIQLDGLVATNTTIGREKLVTEASKIGAMGAGGLSGVPLRERSTEVIQYMSKKLPPSIPIIASGGIFTATDARQKIDAGATLVEVWTGFIYEGPFIAKKIANGLNPHPQEP